MCDKCVRISVLLHEKRKSVSRWKYIGNNVDSTTGEKKKENNNLNTDGKAKMIEPCGEGKKKTFPKFLAIQLANFIEQFFSLLSFNLTTIFRISFSRTIPPIIVNNILSKKKKERKMYKAKKYIYIYTMNYERSRLSLYSKNPQVLHWNNFAAKLDPLLPTKRADDRVKGSNNPLLPGLSYLRALSLAQ